MSTPGSDDLWAFAGAVDLVPSAPDEVLADTLAAWWSQPRTFGCVSARGGPWWHLVMPSPDIWCASCAGDRYTDERRCAYCHGPLRLSRADTLAFEMAGFVKVLGRAHRHCGEQAAARGDRR